ncbi:MAG: CBS domain-containing protein [Rhizobiales bacterium]|nr:CBS domain-containing protein [Hyphomicrobiales bacterium]
MESLPSRNSDFRVNLVQAGVHAPSLYGRCPLLNAGCSGLVAVTAHADSTLGRAADVVLLLPAAREACPHNLAPTTSALMQLALGDALAIALLESRGFTPVDFRVFHPGGRLGAMLKFVRDLMKTGDALPLVVTGTPMADAVAEMSRKGAGCVGIADAQGRLVGIITDGDLRRHIGSNLLALSVEAVMTPSPKTVRPDQLASEALELINASKITVLMVIEDGRPIGILHFHDLLRAGVA